MGTIVKTYEEWGFFKKELTPDEEYQKQKKQALRDKVKPGNAPEVEPGEEDDNDEEDRQMNRRRVNMFRNLKGDAYGEEFWEDEGA